MKASMSALAPMWSAHRMVQDYVQRIWVPQTERARHRVESNGAEARDLALYVGRLRVRVAEVRVLDVGCTRAADGSGRAVASVVLGSLTPSDVAVQLWVDHGNGRADAHHVLRDAGVGPGGGRRFALDARARDSGGRVRGRGARRAEASRPRRPALHGARALVGRFVTGRAPG